MHEFENGNCNNLFGDLQLDIFVLGLEDLL